MLVSGANFDALPQFALLLIPRRKARPVPFAESSFSKDKSTGLKKKREMGELRKICPKHSQLKPLRQKHFK